MLKDIDKHYICLGMYCRRKPMLTYILFNMYVIFIDIKGGSAKMCFVTYLFSYTSASEQHIFKVLVLITINIPLLWGLNKISKDHIFADTLFNMTYMSCMSFMMCGNWHMNKSLVRTSKIQLNPKLQRKKDDLGYLANK